MAGLILAPYSIRELNIFGAMCSISERRDRSRVAGGSSSAVRGWYLQVEYGVGKTRRDGHGPLEYIRARDLWHCLLPPPATAPAPVSCPLKYIPTASSSSTKLTIDFYCAYELFGSKALLRGYGDSERLWKEFFHS